MRTIFVTLMRSFLVVYVRTFPVTYQLRKPTATALEAFRLMAQGLVAWPSSPDPLACSGLWAWPQDPVTPVLNPKVLWQLACAAGIYGAL